jgi:sugar phosphate isomerase/epimerase
MKFAICNELYESWNTAAGFDFARVFEYVRKTGYGGVEIAPFTIAGDVAQISAEKRRSIAELAEKNGLVITGLHWLLAKTNGFHLTSPDVAVRQKTVRYFSELIRLCADLNGSTMVLGSPKQRNLLPGVTLEQAYGYAADILTQLVPVLADAKVQITLEPLSPKETDFLTNAAECVRLIEMVAAPQQISLHLDCKAMAAGTLPIPEVIRNNAKYLTSFHLNDPNLQGPGFGTLDFVPIVQALNAINYNGWLSVEVFDYSPGIEALTEKSLEYMHTCLAATP